MKEKILQQLKTKYKNLGLSDKVLESIAEMIDAKNIEETQIETEVTGVENLLKSFQSDADKRVTDAVAKAKVLPKTEAETQPAQAGGEKKEDEEVPAWAKAILSKVEAMEAGNTTSSRKQTLETKLAAVNPTIKAKILKDFERMSFKDDEDFNAYVEETEKDLEDYQQAETESNLGAFGAPAKTAGMKDSKVSDKEINAILDQIM